jgi:hypothetical protein
MDKAEKERELSRKNLLIQLTITSTTRQEREERNTQGQ